MRKHEKVPATIGQVGEIAGAIIGEMNLSKDEAKVIVGDLGVFRKDVREFWKKYRTKSTSPDNIGELGRWIQVYEKLFTQTPNFSRIVIPAKPEGQGPMRLIVVAKEIIDWTGHKPLRGTMNVLKLHFQCWQYTSDLDTNIPTNARDPRNGSYALWVKDVREADAENASLSANDLSAKNHLGLTVLERMLLEADYFFEQGGHLDLQNWTLCDGSRDSDGDVPSAGWRGGKFGVDWFIPADRDPSIRSRRAYL